MYRFLVLVILLLEVNVSIAQETDSIEILEPMYLGVHAQKNFLSPAERSVLQSQTLELMQVRDSLQHLLTLPRRDAILATDRQKLCYEIEQVKRILRTNEQLLTGRLILVGREDAGFR